MAHLDVTATEDVSTGLLAEKSTSAPLLDREPEEHIEQATQESASQGTLRNRHGTKGELVAAHCCSSTMHVPTLPIGIRKWSGELSSARCQFSGVEQERCNKLVGFSLSLSFGHCRALEGMKPHCTLHHYSPSPAPKAGGARTESSIDPKQCSLLTLPLSWELLAALLLFLLQPSLPVPSPLSGTFLSLTVGHTAPKPEAQSCLQNITTENTDQEKAKESLLLKGEEKKLPLCVTHRPEGADPPGTSNEAQLIFLLSQNLSQPFLRV